MTSPVADPHDHEAPCEAAARAEAALRRERIRHRAAYGALLRENADLRRQLVDRKQVVATLRPLKTVRGWFAFQARRLSPRRVIGRLRRRRAR
jgi:hypothetical protein